MIEQAIFEAGGVRLTLLTPPAAYWASQRTLFLSDVHLGKTTAYRSSGIPVPDSILEDLQRLSNVIETSGACRVVVLGDLVHSQDGLTEALVETVADWRRTHKHVELALVPGNHDSVDHETLAYWRVHVLPEVHQEGPFVLRHDPAAVDGDPVPAGYLLSGHIHPGVSFTGRAHQHMRLPCFVMGQHRAILPAFGSFTGSGRFDVQHGDRIFAIAGEKVVEVGC